MGKKGRRLSQIGSNRNNEQWVYLGSEFDRWQMIKIKSGASSDIELLTMLVDSYIKYHMKDSELLKGTICTAVTSDHVEKSAGSTEERAKEDDANQQTDIKMECDSDTESPTEITSDVKLDTCVPVVESGIETHKGNSVNSYNQTATFIESVVNTNYRTGTNICSIVNKNKQTETNIGIGVNTSNQTGKNIESQACSYVLCAESSIGQNDRNTDTLKGVSTSLSDWNKESKEDRVNASSEKLDLWTGAFVDFHQISRKTSMEAERGKSKDNAVATSTESGKSQQDGSPGGETQTTVMMCGEELITIKVEKDDDTENQSELKEEVRSNPSHSSDVTPSRSTVIIVDEAKDKLIQSAMSPQEPLDGSYATSEIAIPSNKSKNGNPETYTNFDDSEKKEFKCKVCLKSFSTKSNLRRHEKTHSDSEFFKYKECTVKLDSNEGMQAHMTTAHGHIYLCSDCGKECGTKTNLNKHMRIKHSDTLVGLQKPIICPVDGCGRSFVHKTKYEDHLFTHSDIKPHSCEICAKSFSSRYSRSLHQRKCTGEVVIQCDICKITLSDPTSLKRHKEAQHSLNRYTCICGKKFKYKSNLARHKKMHTIHK